MKRSAVPIARVTKRKRTASEGKANAGISVRTVVELSWAQKIDSNYTIRSFAAR